MPKGRIDRRSPSIATRVVAPSSKFQPTKNHPGSNPGTGPKAQRVGHSKSGSKGSKPSGSSRGLSSNSPTGPTGSAESKLSLREGLAKSGPSLQGLAKQLNRIPSALSSVASLPHSSKGTANSVRRPVPSTLTATSPFRSPGISPGSKIASALLMYLVISSLFSSSEGADLTQTESAKSGFEGFLQSKMTSLIDTWTTLQTDQTLSKKELTLFQVDITDLITNLETANTLVGNFLTAYDTYNAIAKESVQGYTTYNSTKLNTAKTDLMTAGNALLEAGIVSRNDDMTTLAASVKAAEESYSGSFNINTQTERVNAQALESEIIANATAMNSAGSTNQGTSNSTANATMTGLGEDLSSTAARANAANDVAMDNQWTTLRNMITPIQGNITLGLTAARTVNTTLSDLMANFTSINSSLVTVENSLRGVSSNISSEANSTLDTFSVTHNATVEESIATLAAKIAEYNAAVSARTDAGYQEGNKTIDLATAGSTLDDIYTNGLNTTTNTTLEIAEEFSAELTRLEGILADNETTLSGMESETNLRQELATKQADKAATDALQAKIKKIQDFLEGTKDKKMENFLTEITYIASNQTGDNGPLSTQSPVVQSLALHLTTWFPDLFNTETTADSSSTPLAQSNDPSRNETEQFKDIQTAADNLPDIFVSGDADQTALNIASYLTLRDEAWEIGQNITINQKTEANAGATANVLEERIALALLGTGGVGLTAVSGLAVLEVFLAIIAVKRHMKAKKAGEIDLEMDGIGPRGQLADDSGSEPDKELEEADL